jgi:hypothetical protein
MACARAVVVAALLVALATGCTGPLPSGFGGPPSATATANPSMTGAVPTPVDGPPGGGETFPAPSPGVHCVEASYLANDVAPIPDGVRFVVTEVELAAGSKYVSIGGSGCTAPLCTANFAWVDGGETCEVALTETRGWNGEKSISLRFAGKADCRAVPHATCVDYVKKVKQKATTLDAALESTRLTTTTTPEETGTTTTGPSETTTTENTTEDTAVSTTT